MTRQLKTFRRVLFVLACCIYVKIFLNINTVKNQISSKNYVARIIKRSIADQSFALTTESVLEPPTLSLIQEEKTISNFTQNAIVKKNAAVVKRKLKTAHVMSNAPLRVIDSSEISLSEEQIRNIKEEVKKRNSRQEIINESIFGPVQKNTTIIVIQIHNRIENLRFLIKSLTEATYIEKCLVVFSHDFWSSEINEFISNITAFRAMQIFFPFSVQLHPRAFPGLDPRDCPWNFVSKSRKTSPRALKTRACLNEPWPDSYGHYREPMITQLKQHWWWKANWVFDHLNVTRNWTGDALLLEDDNYVTPDVVHTLWLLRGLPSSSNTSMLSLGNFNTYSPEIYRNTVIVGDLGSTQDATAYAFNAVMWAAIKKNSEFYCTRDDYNWDWTMVMLVQQDRTLRGKLLGARLTRVHHISSCKGTHVIQQSCNVSASVDQVRHKIEAAQQFFYPEKLTIISMTKSVLHQIRVNGGWSDIRDIELCRAITNGTASEATIAKLQHLDFVL